jgi:peptidoglycan/xylan/chitin deacetylase (PgdA/CDA1 family)
MRTRILALLLQLAALSPALAAEPPVVPILTYHRFDPAAAPSTTIVVTAVFEEQMAWLAANHYQIIPLRRLVETLRGGPPVEPKSIVLTVDDGFRSVYTQMFPIIRRAKLPVTLFINPPMIGAGAYLSWTQLAEMQATGLVDIQPHTQTHPNFNTERTRRSPADFQAFLTAQIDGSRHAIQAKLAGQPADLLAWPYGIHDPELEAAASRAGYIAAFALGSRAATPGGDPFAIPRYQVYNTDRGPIFAGIAEGKPRGRSAR